MKQLFVTLALVLSSAVFAYGQQPTVPGHPIIVQRLVLTDQTANLGSPSSPISLFTPDHDGLFRITYALQSVGPPSHTCGTLCVGASLYVDGSQLLGFGENAYNSPFDVALLLKAGQSLSYSVTVSSYDKQQPYDLVIVVEEI